jgi:hypothetical protein
MQKPKRQKPLKLVLYPSLFWEFLIKVFGEPFRSLNTCLKVERTLDEKTLDVEAIRIWLPEFMKEVDCTVERKEHPKIRIQHTIRKKTGLHEFTIVFLGGVKDRHVEDLGYWESNPLTWKSFGGVILTLEQGKAFGEFLIELYERYVLLPQQKIFRETSLNEIEKHPRENTPQHNSNGKMHRE